MVAHNSKNKTTAMMKVKMYRNKGYNASAKKTKSGWKVYTDQKGKR